MKKKISFLSSTKDCDFQVSSASVVSRWVKQSKTGVLQVLSAHVPTVMLSCGRRNK